MRSAQMENISFINVYSETTVLGKLLLLAPWWHKLFATLTRFADLLERLCLIAFY
jgi:hypothetical protein